MTDPQAAAAHHRHELRTPINHILGYAELLIEDAEDQGRQDRAEGLKAIRALGKRVSELGDLLPPPDDAVAVAAPEGAGPLRGLLDAIAAGCDALEAAATPGPDRDSFAADLAKIRAACDRLTRLLATGPNPPVAAPE